MCIDGGSSKVKCCFHLVCPSLHSLSIRYIAMRVVQHTETSPSLLPSHLPCFYYLPSIPFISSLPSLVLHDSFHFATILPYLTPIFLSFSLPLLPPLLPFHLVLSPSPFSPSPPLLPPLSLPFLLYSLVILSFLPSHLSPPLVSSPLVFRIGSSDLRADPEDPDTAEETHL